MKFLSATLTLGLFWAAARLSESAPIVASLLGLAGAAGFWTSLLFSLQPRRSRRSAGLSPDC